MQNLQAHFTHQTLDSGITIYRVGNFNFATVEAWLQQAHADDQTALVQQVPRCSLTDISQAGYPNPYTLRRLSEVARQTPQELNEAFAVLVANKGVLSLLPHLIRYLPAKYQEHTRLFVAAQEGEALTWLEERYRALQ